IAGKGFEAGLVGMRFAGERECHHGAAMERIVEYDDCGPLAVGAGNLDRIFYSFGAGIDEQRLLGEFARRERVQFFGDGDITFVWRDAEAEVQVFFELRADGRVDFRRTVAGVQTTYAAGEVEKVISIDIFDDSARRARGEHRCGVVGSARDG